MQNKQQQRFYDYVSLSSKNNKILQQIYSTLLKRKQTFFLSDDMHFRQAKMQYQFILNSNQQSISKNKQLQQQLQRKQYQVQVLHQKLQKNTKNIEAINTQMQRITKSLEKDQKGKKKLRKVEEEREKLKKKIDNLNRTNRELSAEDQTWAQKQPKICMQLKNKQKQIQSIQISHNKSKRQSQQRVSELQRQVNSHRQLLKQLRQLNAKAVPYKKDHTSTFQDLQLMISKHRQQEHL